MRRVCYCICGMRFPSPYALDEHILRKAVAAQKVNPLAPADIQHREDRG